MAMNDQSDIAELKDNIMECKEFEASGQANSDFEGLPIGIDLKKLLVQITGIKDIRNITKVKLKVVTKQAGLHRLAEYTPRLKILILDGSYVDSLRDLGSSLHLLENLSVSRCNLKSLDGLWGFQNLKTLIASHNSITDVSPCSGVEKLAALDVSNNEIEDLSYFIFLRNCKYLRILDVAGNCFNDYKDTIINLVPQVRILDGERIQENEGPSDKKDNFQNKDDTTFQDEDEILSPEDKDKQVSSNAIKDNDVVDFASRTKYRPKSPQTAYRQLGAGDEDFFVSRIRNDHRQIIEHDDSKIREKERNLDSSLSSNFPMTEDFKKISTFDLIINTEKCQQNLETLPSGLSSGRAICGNLAISLRSRNITKNSFTLPTVRANSLNK